KARTTQYVPVRQLTGTRTSHYCAIPLKSTVDGRLREKSTVGGRLRKKKGRGRRRRGKEERRRRGEEAIPCPRALTARGQLFSPRRERDRGDVAPPLDLTKHPPTDYFMRDHAMTPCRLLSLLSFMELLS
ncbi:hypothetical protein GW17_00038419, partial [Ensete ventricosum]